MAVQGVVAQASPVAGTTRTWKVSVAVLCLLGGLLRPGGSAWAQEVEPVLDPQVVREEAVFSLLWGGPSQQRAAETALLGGDEDVREFVASGRTQALQEDERAAVRVLASSGPLMEEAAQRALEGTPEDVSAFLDGGWEAPWETDERRRASVMKQSAGPAVRDELTRLLAEGSTQELSDFLAEGVITAEQLDDHRAVRAMTPGGPVSGGAVLAQAATQVLKTDSPEAIRDFLEWGQYVARARDEELASVQDLTVQAKSALQVASREADAAVERSERAVSASAQARSAALEAQAQASDTKTSARGADAAAGRAADAAAGAAVAATEAVGAANATMRAAQVASDAARQASTAAAATARAASQARWAAVQAGKDSTRAAEARKAAEAARDAADRLEELEQVKSQRDRALEQARTAGKAASSAAGHAAGAADAADQAGSQAQVSAQQAQRSRAAAAQARASAGEARRAAGRAEDFAGKAQTASQTAFALAQRAAAQARAAADAADKAADAAGKSKQTAAQAQVHATAASEAADLAVAAVTQAQALEALARQADQVRLEEKTAQQVAVARDALEQETQALQVGGEIAAWNRELTWDTAEQDRIDEAARGWLGEATGPAASAETVVDRGRRAALRLSQTGGQWTRAAAVEALAADETGLRAWLDHGRVLAAGQDDRARLGHLVDVLSDGNERTAAREALDGDDATVERFLRTREYPGKESADRRRVSSLRSGGGPMVAQAAAKALQDQQDPATAMDRFLREELPIAQETDERLRARQVKAAGGPEVQAAADVALAGPASYVTYFLEVSQYQAAQRDREQAAHVASVRASIQQAQRYANLAVAEAARANNAALVAASAAAKAQEWKQKADKAEQVAADWARQASESAQEARRSAEDAADSAAIARDASQRADVAAGRASRSAVAATAAAEQAGRDAAGAFEAKREAAASSRQAGVDARGAQAAADEAARIYTDKLAAEQARQHAAQAEVAGTGEAAAGAGSWRCLSEKSMSTACLGVYKDFATALVAPARCSAPANAETAGCLMYRDVKAFAGENSQVLADVLGLVLTLCGMVPGAGEACDIADAALSAKRGDWVGSILSAGSAVPVLGYAATAAKCLKNSDRIRNVLRLADRIADGKPGAGCLKGACGIPGGSCFVAGTLVRTERGSVPIEKIKPGDRVWSRNMATGRDELQPVRAVYTRTVTHLLSLRIAGGTVTSTVDHPFHVAGQGFTRAVSLNPGDQLTTPSGSTPLEARRPLTQTAAVYNLNIDTTHTYYVISQGIPLLVHNANASDPCGAAVNAVASLHDDVVLVRGGTNTLDRFVNGSGVESDVFGNLSGVSVNSGNTIEEASRGIRNNQIGVSTVGEVREAGGTVVQDPTPYNPGHCLISGCSGETLSELFTPTIKNPSK